MRQFHPRMFPVAVMLRPAAYPLSAQGGPQPAPQSPGVAAFASVQPGEVRQETRDGVPLSREMFRVFLPRNLGATLDATIAAMRQGDEVDADGRTLVVRGKAVPRGRYGNVLWLLVCEATDS